MISPSRNDQWSGKTFRSRTRTPRAPWSRSSSQRAGAFKRPFDAHDRSQKLGPTGSWKSLGRDQEALRVHADRQLRQRPGRRAEDHPRALRRVEGRLMAGAQDVVGGLLVQGGRAAHVRADLGVGDDVVDRPVLDDLVGHAWRAGANCSWPGRNLMMMTAALAIASSLSRKPSGPTLMIAPGELNSAGVIGRLVPYTISRRPLRQTVVSRLFPGSGPRSRSRKSGATPSGTRGGDEAAADHRPLDELAGLGAFLEGLLERGPVLLGVDRSGCRCSVSSTVGHQVPDPDDGADAEQQEDQRQRGARGPGSSAAPW